jgi:hypothetical protein
MTSENLEKLKSVHRAILNRKARPARINGQLNAAIKMAESINLCIQNPTNKNLTNFIECEKIWLEIVGGQNKSYAKELRDIFKNLPTEPINVRTINSAYNSNYDPPYGYVYGMTSVQYPGLIKLGATSRNRHPQDRQIELQKKYQINELKIIFFCEVEFPARVEKEWTKRFFTRRAQLTNKESREWFEFDPIDAKNFISQILADLKIKEIGNWYLHRTIRNGKKNELIIEGRKAPLGTLNQLSENQSILK